MSFTIDLSRYKLKYVFDRNRFLRLYPNSLIANILNVSSDTEIIIYQRFVTDFVMRILYIITEKKQVPLIGIGADGLSLQRSGDYFNIDILCVLGDPQWYNFNIYVGHLDILDSKDYEQLFIRGVTSGFLCLVDYLLKHDVDPSLYNNLAIRLAIARNYDNIVRRLLRDSRFKVNTHDDRVYYVNSYNTIMIDDIPNISISKMIEDWKILHP